VLVVLAAGLAVGLAVAVVRAGASRQPAGAGASARSGDDSSAGAPEPPAAALLRAWDEQRAAAYAAGSARMLRDLYVPGSRAGRADLRVLRAYAGRGLRVEGMRTQVLALRVLVQGPRRSVLEVTDRVADAVAVDGSVRVPLPRDGADTRRVELIRGPDGAWRVASVRPLRPLRNGAVR